jgi:AcrR family transcriptional regulator
MMVTNSTQMLRVDAQENRDRVLAAARALFSEKGLDVAMRDVARRAEVGPATLYRRFPTKQALIDEAFAEELRLCRQIVEDGCADPDAWNGFTTVVRRLSVLNARNRGFVDAFTSADSGFADLGKHRSELLGMVARLADRAKLQGRLRRDFVVDDLVLILLAGRGLSAVPSASRDAAAIRFASLTVDAFRPPEAAR